MFILNEKDVEHCRCNYRVAGSDRTICVIEYYGNLFVKVESYGTEQFKEAVSHCRHFLDMQESVASIVVKEKNGFSVWRANDLDLILNQNLLVGLHSSGLDSFESKELPTPKQPAVLLTLASILLCF